MKQILQSLKDGSTEVLDVPVPMPRAQEVLITTSVSLVSAGTERMLVEFGKGSLLSKARQQPDKVRMVMGKARTDGVFATLDAVRSKLDQPLALGYCNVGRVAELGSKVIDFDIGTRVVSNGKHAGVVAVPRNLVASIPENVSDDAASFTVLAAIGLQGIRLVQPTLGESVAVTGLGLIGLLTVQMLVAQGCQVLGIDPSKERRDLAESFGATVAAPGEAATRLAQTLSRDHGVDAVIITASSPSNAIIAEAAEMCRKRGRIVLVGVIGLELSRADFYEKELSFQVSCSYGPGRYDPDYEEGGQDYPIGFVRWTEGRNFEAVLNLMAAGSINVEPLITHRFAIEDGAKAMELLASSEPSMGILFDYGAADATVTRDVAIKGSQRLPANPSKARVAVLGAGNYASRTLVPALASAGAALQTIVSAAGVSAVHHGRRHGFARAATDEASAWTDPDVNTVVIATRHDAHARQVLAALEADKHVFCEKPLCLTLEELDQIEAAARARPHLNLMVGFNRRFAPHAIKMRDLLAEQAVPVHLTLTMNAGQILNDHWTQDEALGGGRIVGEACHFIDLARFLAGSPVSDMKVSAMGPEAGASPLPDRVTMLLTFENGSVAVVNYLSNGPKALAKERIEAIAGGRALQLDNFLRLSSIGWPGFSKMKLWKQDKGNATCINAFISAIEEGTPSPVTLEETLQSSRLAILAAEAAR